MAGGGAGDKAAAELRSTIDFVAAELAVLSFCRRAWTTVASARLHRST